MGQSLDLKDILQSVCVELTGIFEIRNVPQDQLQLLVGVACPQTLHPYLRAIVSDVCIRAGFPPILLPEVNFQAMFEQQQAAGQPQ